MSDDNPLQLVNEPAANVVCAEGKSMAVKPVHPAKAVSPIEMEADGVEIVSVVNPVQYLKASFPMVETDAGMTIVVKLAQVANAFISMAVREDGNKTAENRLLPSVLSMVR